MGPEDREGMSSESTIDYDALTQDAMRSVVRRVLEDTIRFGLPGDHHFYVSFDTSAPGVVLSKRLRDKYNEEMTIVLQHRFWDLAVADDYFEVKLTFDGIPERLVIPFRAIKVFFDPSVRYGLQFEAVDLNQEAQAPSVIVERGDLEPDVLDAKDGLRQDHDPPALPSEPAAVLLADTEGELAAEAETGAADNSDEDVSPSSDGEAGEATNDDQDPGDAKVVSLDAFRKK